MIAPRLADLLNRGVSTAVVATASIAAGLLGADDTALMLALARRLEESDPTERWAAAIALGLPAEA